MAHGVHDVTLNTTI